MEGKQEVYREQCVKVERKGRERKKRRVKDEGGGKEELKAVSKG